MTADLLELIAEADAAKAAGIARAQAGTDMTWAATAEQAVRYLAGQGRPFQAFDLIGLGVPEPLSPAHWGSLFHRMAKAGVIRPAGAVPSLRPTVAGSLCRQWVGA
jgi:hypothetical protein